MRIQNAPTLLVIAVCVVGTLSCLSGCATDVPVADGDMPEGWSRYRIVTYGKSFTTKNDCGGTTLIVKPGDSVCWINTTGATQVVTFDPDDKLIFGVDKIEVAKGAMVVLKVDDGLPGDPTHQFRFSLTTEAVKDFVESSLDIEEQLRVEEAAGTATEIPVGPPGIIVCPPNQTCG